MKKITLLTRICKRWQKKKVQKGSVAAVMDFFVGVIEKLRWVSLYVISLPAALFLVVFSPIVSVKLMRLFSSRIGHYALNTELLLCAIDASSCSKKKKYFFIIQTWHLFAMCNYILCGDVPFLLSHCHD